MAVEIYAVGTLEVIQGERIVTLSGSGAAWFEAWALPGNQLAIQGEAQSNYVKRWISATQVELALPVERAGASGLTYSMLITAPAFGTNREGTLTNIERIRLMTENEQLAELLGIGSSAPVSPSLADRLAGWDASNGNAVGPMILRSLLQAGSALLPKTAHYQVTVDDYGVTIGMSAGAGARIVTLPLASEVGAGFEIGIKKVDASANTVTVQRAGATLDGEEKLALSARGATVRLVCDGTNWHLLTVGNAAPWAQSMLALPGAGDKLAYLNSASTAALTDLTEKGRAMLARSNNAGVLEEIGAQAALGYASVNKAGDTMTGGLLLPKLASVNVTIADDAVYSVPIPFGNGLVILSSGSMPSSVPPARMYWIRRSANAPVRVASFNDTNISLLVGTLTGTTEPDGNVSLSVANAGTVFQYENRSGAAQSVTMTFFGGA